MTVAGHPTDPETIVAVVVLLTALHARELVRARLPDRLPWTREEDPQDALRERYVSGEVGLAEYERELDLLMDTSNDRIRERVEPVDGIGSTVSREVALAFESVGQLERADRADLLAVEDVGPERADAILERVR